MNRPTVLVTGASGVVGRAVVAELVGRGCRVYGGVHTLSSVPGLYREYGMDVGVARLGLSDPTWGELVREVDVVVHSAAVTAWGRPQDEYHRINVAGTEHVIRFCAAAGARLHFVSTAFVGAVKPGAGVALSEGNVVSDYIRSKLAAEQLVAGSGLPYSISRPTNIVGDSGTGASFRPQIVQQLCEWILRGKAPFIPWHPENRFDFIPLDTVAAAVASASLQMDELPSTDWHTFGPLALDAVQTIGILLNHAERHGKRLTQIPPVVDPREGLPTPLAMIDGRNRTFIQVLRDVSEVTWACGGVLPDSLQRLTDVYGMVIPDPAAAFDASLTYWANDRAESRQ